mmetsp:Transcript_79568/g.179484  ORF Transcript_79568/g.179484 Transcript_79568/m.179484 type:complete len:208 (+) Transcript_79568:716-1339(+)
MTQSNVRDWSLSIFSSILSHRHDRLFHFLSTFLPTSVLYGLYWLSRFLFVTQWGISSIGWEFCLISTKLGIPPAPNSKSLSRASCSCREAFASMGSPVKCPSFVSHVTSDAGFLVRLMNTWTTCPLLTRGITTDLSRGGSTRRSKSPVTTTATVRCRSLPAAVRLPATPRDKAAQLRLKERRNLTAGREQRRPQTPRIMHLGKVPSG